VTFRIVDPSIRPGGGPLLWIGGRSFPWAQIFREDIEMPTVNHYTRRARLMFENGWTVSIIWGSCTYSSNHGHGLYDVEFTETPETVELAIATDRLVDLSSSPEHKHLEQYFQGDSVAGYLTADQVLAVIDDVMTWPSPPKVSL
jgi:hypothetical protein